MMENDRTFVIAEAGVNHNGSMDLAKRLIDAAADTGADAVKFQSFKAARLTSRSAPKAAYQSRAIGDADSQYEMLKRLELDDAAHSDLLLHARDRGIRLLSTPFDPESLDLLLSYGMRLIKVSSGDITDAPFLLEISRKADELILSTGMASLGEIEAALSLLAFGFTARQEEIPNTSSLAEAYASAAGQAALRTKVTLLHCTTEYPAPFGEINLRAMDTLSTAFGLPVGYSDHTRGIHISIAAVARGARIIEKHFTLSREMPGPDHAASLEPAELAEMISSIRDVEAALGSAVKHPSASERKNLRVARKSLVAARDIAAGSPLLLACKRTGVGLSPFEYWRLQGTPAPRDYCRDEPIDG